MKPEHLELQSADGCQLNLDALYQIAPSCFTEAKGPDGKTRRVVNFDVLRQLLGDAAADSVNNWGEEFYQFTWPGKAEARREAARPIKKTLRPVVEDSVDWDTTQNLYIEGDNLEVLKLLQKSYLGKVKMIYIDPPYNTGNDFVYDDDFSQSASDYAETSGDVDELGNRYRKNTDSNGRFHSDWCSMIYSRLQLARTLLAENGIIFISIDDNEVDNLRKICDDVFGESNFESCIAWRRRTNQPNDKSKMIAKVSENILVYSKNSSYLTETKSFNGVPLSDERIAGYSNPDNDPRGPWSSNPWKAATGRGGTKYRITTPLGIEYDETWYGNRETFDHLIAENKVHWTDNGKGVPRIKIYLSEAMRSGQAAINFFTCERYGSNQEGSATLDDLFGRKGLFDNPKPVKLISTFINLSTNDNDLILDFFSGSSTTAHAVFDFNAKNSTNRRFIMVQLPEETEADSEARKAGYANICEIGKERIRRAGKKVKEEAGLIGQDLDIGFRVFRVDESNMEDVYFQPKAYSQDKLDMFLDNIKADRTDLDLLFGAMLDWGVQLSLPMKCCEVVKSCSSEASSTTPQLQDSTTPQLQNSTTVYVVNEGDLVACFSENISEEVIEFIAEQSPLRVLLRDSCFSSDADKINIFEQFKQRLGWSDEEAYKNVRVL